MAKKKQTGIDPKTIRWIWIAAFAPFALVAVMLTLTALGVFGRMPSFEELENPRSNLATEIFSEDGKVIGSFFVQNRSYVQYDDLFPRDSAQFIRLGGHDVPPVVAALISTEDVRFRSHSGIDIPSLARVAVKTVGMFNLSQGGGSTITQQLAKNLYFTQEKEFTRKIAEMFMAWKLESQFSKDEILELYVNSIYFGSGCYNVGDACREYFGKDPSQMDDYEATLLAGIPNAPSVYDLNENPDLAHQRQKQVLGLMVKYSGLDPNRVDSILACAAPAA